MDAAAGSKEKESNSSKTPSKPSFSSKSYKPAGYNALIGSNLIRVLPFGDKIISNRFVSFGTNVTYAGIRPTLTRLAVLEKEARAVRLSNTDDDANSNTAGYGENHANKKKATNGGSDSNKDENNNKTGSESSSGDGEENVEEEEDDRRYISYFDFSLRKRRSLFIYYYLFIEFTFFTVTLKLSQQPCASFSQTEGLQGCQSLHKINMRVLCVLCMNCVTN